VSRSLGRIHSQLILVTILLLFFLQLVSDFVETTYGLCLITTSMNINALSVLLMLLPLVLLSFRRGLPHKLAIVAGEVVVLCRILEPMLVTKARMIVSGIGVGCFLVFFPTLLLQKSQSDEKQTGLRSPLGLCIALALSIFFRTLGITIDISTYSWYQFIGWIMAAIAAIMIASLPQTRRDEDEYAKKVTSIWKLLGLTLGIMSVLVLVYFAFSSPTVISRWTQGNYIAITVVLISAVALFAIAVTLKSNIINRANLWVIMLLNGLFVSALVFTIASHQISFPSEQSGYPVDASPTSTVAHISLYLMLALSPVIMVDFAMLIEELVRSKPTPRQMGGCFLLGSLYLISIVFANIFTITYDYIPVIGPLFRDMLWLVFMIPGLAMVLSILFTNRNSSEFSYAPRVKGIIIGLMGFICAGTIVGVVINDSHPAIQTGEKASAAILTYNILVGRNVAGIRNYDGQLAKIRDIDADIIGLQESGTARIAGGNSDAVRYFASKLNLYSYYGPKTVTGTFGNALLSKYPIESARTFYMYGKGEQTACIEAQITVGSRTFSVFVTHLGNSGDPSQIYQQKAILERLEGKSNVILMGDFNFRPDTEQYRLTTHVLNNSWQLNSPAVIDKGRIDHIFLSPGIAVIDSEYLESNDSDHPALRTVIGL
jgi:endonuclease/exonuclease/phosphatase family metal-dependent hydrolase